MRSINLNKLTLATLVLSLGILACEKEKEIIAPWDTAGPDGRTAHLRIVHASPNLATIAGATTDLVNVFANGTKVNGVRLAYAGLFPAQTPTTYAAVPAGAVDLKISIGGAANTTNFDSIPITTLRVNMDAGKYYSLVITDSILNGSKDSAKIFVNDVFTTPNTGAYGLRVINAMKDTGANQRVDIWSARRNNTLYTNIQTGTIGAFANLAFINIPDTLIVRRAGTTTELARINTITFANTKVYTLILRGEVNVTGTKAKTLTWFSNR
ncbi:MAG TPA: DUF4397 domain-containing protein [Phnomibacter sp.]|nr:DUF4397 domain-containing protein [Phnomibacter sp.]